MTFLFSFRLNYVIVRPAIIYGIGDRLSLSKILLNFVLAVPVLRQCCVFRTTGHAFSQKISPKGASVVYCLMQLILGLSIPCPHMKQVAPYQNEQEYWQSWQQTVVCSSAVGGAPLCVNFMQDFHHAQAQFTCVFDQKSGALWLIVRTWRCIDSCVDLRK